MLRRSALKVGLAATAAGALGTTGYPGVVTASELSDAPEVNGLRQKLAAALRSIGNEGCTEAARRLETAERHDEVLLHLRGVGLNASGVARIADALSALTEAEASSLVSLSLSYNAAIGDAGAVPLAHALPPSLRELGLVGCRVGDAGGNALLHWARQAAGLRMLCIEDNQFSEALTTRIRELPRTSPRLSVYV